MRQKGRIGGGRKKRRLKRRLFRARGNVCCFCGITLSFATATIEHVVPFAEGGSYRIENLALSCAPCNAARGTVPFPVWRAIASAKVKITRALRRAQPPRSAVAKSGNRSPIDDQKEQRMAEPAEEGQAIRAVATVASTLSPNPKSDPP